MDTYRWVFAAFLKGLLVHGVKSYLQKHPTETFCLKGFDGYRCVFAACVAFIRHVYLKECTIGFFLQYCTPLNKRVIPGKERATIFTLFRWGLSVSIGPYLSAHHWYNPFTPIVNNSCPPPEIMGGGGSISRLLRIS